MLFSGIHKELYMYRLMVTNIIFPQGLNTFSLKKIHLSIYKTDFKERQKVLLIKFGK